MGRVNIEIKEDNGSKRKIGYMEGDTFYSSRQRSRHFFRKDRSWAIDAEVLGDLKTVYGVTYVEILDTENDTSFKTTVASFLENGNHRIFPPHRLQLFLQEQYWSEVN